jgi:cobalamin biosynthesis Co2+ chelatase CbiK
MYRVGDKLVYVKHGTDHSETETYTISKIRKENRIDLRDYNDETAWVEKDMVDESLRLKDGKFTIKTYIKDHFKEGLFNVT